jgi:hypothetical protein
MKIRMASRHRLQVKVVDPLDMTRIHIESYTVALKVACDAYGDRDKMEGKIVSD